MILFTKEVFIKAKTLTHLYVNIQACGATRKQETWEVFLQGTVTDATPNGEAFHISIVCISKKEAYRIFKELARQIVDSGEVPELNTKLVDAILKE